MSERGVYRNDSKGKQLLKFQGIRFENITPTDIDGAIELRGKAWVFYEAKTANADCEYGQKRMLYELTKDTASAGKHVLTMIVEHLVEDERRSVYLCSAKVREWITSENLRWTQPKHPITAGVATFKFVEKFLPELIHANETAMYSQLIQMGSDNGFGNMFAKKASKEDVEKLLKANEPAWYSILTQFGQISVIPDGVTYTPNNIFGEDYADNKRFEISEFMMKHLGIPFIYNKNK